MIRTALVGLGDIGRNAHLPALLRHPRVEVSALADPSTEHRRLASQLAGPGARLAVDLDEVLADADAVVLATPPWVTGELAVRAVRAGKYVLAEKPVATSTETARVYDQLSSDERRRLQVGLTYRHDPAIRALAEWIDSGALGHPLLVRAHIYDERRDPGTPEHTDRIVATLAHGTPVVHEGAHVFDWLTVMLGETSPDIDDAWSLRTDPALPAANLVGARLRYGDHVALTEFGWLADGLPRADVSVLGQYGHAVLDGVSFTLELSTGSEHRVVEYAGDKTTRCFDRQVQRFVELVEGAHNEPEPGLAAGLAALRTSERVAEAAALNTTQGEEVRG